MLEDQHRAVDVICDGWPRVQATRHRDTLRARNYSAMITASGYADPTGESVAGAGNAEWWEGELRQVLKPFELTPTNPNTLRREWHRLFDEHPTGWLEEMLQRMYRLADITLRWFPLTPNLKSGKPDPIELCGRCQKPVEPGKDAAGQALLRRLGGVPYHASVKGRSGVKDSCYWITWRLQRLAQKTSRSHT